MMVTHGLLQPARGRCALTIGSFDGVHRGHRELIDRVVAKARELSITSCVLTFEPHPREFFAPQSALLSTSTNSPVSGFQNTSSAFDGARRTIRSTLRSVARSA